MPIYDGYTSIIKNNEISKESKKFVSRNNKYKDYI